MARTRTETADSRIGGWTVPYWHDGIGKSFFSLMREVDALLLGRRTYVVHAEAFEPMPPGDPFGDLMNGPAKYVVSGTLEKPIWRNTTIISIRSRLVVESGSSRRTAAMLGSL